MTDSRWQLPQRQEEAQRRYDERVSAPQRPRTEREVASFFDGLDLVPPGGVSAYGGVARKP